MVRHSTKKLSPFSREHLLISVYDSLRHRRLPVEDATALTQTVIGQLLPYVTNGTLERDVIATVTYTVLERFDNAASTVYRAYHPIETKTRKA
ncbi:MAG TPA: hypothetical protein VFT16_01725 [Candidatus Saccharimonadales bacterium]|nr:hypothetical protein [Candidatus Saccharimonadales bacterium]